MQGLIASCVLTGVVLVVFGVVKSLVVQRSEGWRGAAKSGIWTLLIGGCAAGGAFGVVRLLGV